MKHYIYLLVAFTLFLSCNDNKAQKTSMDTDFRFTECEAYYKGKALPFGQPIAEWEKLFGKDYRNIPDDDQSYYKRFIWDELGIVVVEEGHNNEKPDLTTMLYIFYSNLKSPVGSRGKLKFVGEFDIFNAQRKYKEKHQIEDSKYLELFGINEDGEFLNIDLIKEYLLYPFNIYKKSVTIDDAVVSAGMSLQELNKNRKSKDLQIFTFRDDNMNMINESGSTKGDKGEYWNDERKLNCPNQKHFFFNSVQFSGSELEFIKVGYRLQDESSVYF